MTSHSAAPGFLDRARRFLKGGKGATRPSSVEASDAARPDGCLIWVHARHAGDTGPILAIAQELARLRAEPVHTLVTSDDDAPLPFVQEATIRTRLDSGSAAAARFLDRWTPDIGLFIGYPEQAAGARAAHERGIPLFLTSPSRGHVPPRAAAHWLPFFHTCLAASVTEADAFRRLINKPSRVEITGPLSDTGQALTCDETSQKKLLAGLSGRPVWYASHVSLGEVPAVEAAHRAAFKGSHRLLLVLSLREAEHTDRVVDQLTESGWDVTRRSASPLPDEGVQVYFADVPDEAGLWYRVAPISFLGGTLEKGLRPSDPFEAAALGSAILCGPYIDRAPGRFEALFKAGGAVRVPDADGLASALVSHLAPDKTAVLAQAAWGVVTESAHVVERLAELMDIGLDESDAR